MQNVDSGYSLRFKGFIDDAHAAVMADKDWNMDRYLRWMQEVHAGDEEFRAFA